MKRLALVMMLIASACTSKAYATKQITAPQAVPVVSISTTTSTSTSTTVITTTTTSTTTYYKPKTVKPAYDVWYSLAMCETGGKMDNPDTGNGYYGFFQFDIPTWTSVGGSGIPTGSSYETQKKFAQILQKKSGWGKWPSCSRHLGLT